VRFIKEEEFKNLNGIYKITQISNNKVYIGQTKTRFIKRYWHHVWKLRDNSHDNKYMQNTWNKYGEDDFTFEIIHVLDENEDLDELETMYINKYDSYNNGFNLTTGGEGKKDCPMSDYAKKVVGEKNRQHNLGKKHSEVTRQKMSISSPHRKLTKEHINKLTKSRLEKGYSKESKQKMSESHIGSNNAVSVINEAQATIIKQCLINGEKIIDISKSLNINYHVIKTILQCKVWNHVYVEGWNEFIENYNINKKKIISEDLVRLIRKLLEEGYTAEKIANECNVGISVVYGIKQNRTYKNVK
jgi:group I intron endonuclease